MTKQQQQDQAQAIEQLRAILKPGDTVHTILRHVSRSGMLRVIDCYAPGNRWIGSLVARATASRYDTRKQGVRIGGCGMDMGSAIVYDLARRLFPKGFAVVGRGRNGDTSGWDNDGGYALRQEWL